MIASTTRFHPLPAFEELLRLAVADDRGFDRQYGERGQLTVVGYLEANIATWRPQ